MGNCYPLYNVEALEQAFRVLDRRIFAGSDHNVACIKHGFACDRGDFGASSTVHESLCWREDLAAITHDG